MELEVKCPINSINSNGRSYNPDAFKKALDEYKKNRKNAMFGALEHPATYNESPFNKLSAIAVKINDVDCCHNEQLTDEWLNAHIEILDTPDGQIANQLHTSGIPMTIKPSIMSNPETGELQITGFNIVIDREAAIKKQILDFIKHFQNEGTIKAFTEGCCYWFAKILCKRFEMDRYRTMLMYNNIDGHFAAKINGQLYDITGELNETANWEIWDEFKENEPVYSETVIRDCIKKLD